MRALVVTGRTRPDVGQQPYIALGFQAHGHPTAVILHLDPLASMYPWPQNYAAWHSAHSVAPGRSSGQLGIQIKCHISAQLIEPRTSASV